MNSFDKLNKSDLPRERFIREGAETLSDAELIAVLLHTGSKGHNVMEVAEKILSVNSQMDGLVSLMHLSLAEFTAIPGIGEARAIELSAVGEIARRIWNRNKRTSDLSFRNAGAVNDFFKEDLRYLDHEVVYVLYLDNHMQLLKSRMVSEGTCSCSAVSSRDVLISALQAHASCLIVVHNHPSGDCSPSEADRNFTTSLSEACRLVDIPLADHVIIGDNEYFSFREQEII